MSIAVVNLGLPKSGTTTLAKALRLAGYRVADHRIRGRSTSNPELKGRFVAELLYQGYFETGDPGAQLQGITAISEMNMLRGDKSLWPQMDFALIRALRKHHPGIRFLASRRSPFDMSKSMLAWSNLGSDRLPEGHIPGLPAGFGATSKEREVWIDGHYENLRQMFRGSDDFLEYDVSDPGAPDLISGFLDTPLPWWGKLNANPVKEEA